MPTAGTLLLLSRNINELWKPETLYVDVWGPDTQSAIFGFIPTIRNSSKLTMEPEEAT